MSAPFPTLLLATGNPGKLKELRARLDGTGVDVIGLDELPFEVEEVEETGSTFAENAALKATAYGWIAGIPTLADDSGLEVDALGGRPGVYSARYAGPKADDAQNNALLLSELEGVDDRAARFRCVMALYIPAGLLADRLACAALFTPEITQVPPTGAPKPFNPERDGVVLLAEGCAEGVILSAPRGQGGFGYDPLFLSDDLGLTFAEDSDRKKSVSHRGRALDTLLSWLEL